MSEQFDPVIGKSLGTINISPNAIAMVAGIAAMQCFGVVGTASRTIQDGISELLTGKDNLTRGIEVTIMDEQVEINLYIIVEYGVRIQEVAHNVIENVKYAVENQLGLQVSEVNVIVQGVRTNKK
ncbi:MAG TPA: Asp23/Gls24 family envelope stress response protein [Bacillota bacterium]|nr:Asp23/Gls24 family envelope stress response protein [Bacillota bacterium]